MKANELSYKDLMIGDWVIFHDSGYASDGTTWKEDRVCQIDGIDVDVSVKWYDEDGCKEDWPHISTFCLSPIPLTTEILEKNGFEKGYSSTLTIDGYKKLPVYKYKNMKQAQDICRNLIKVCVSLYGSRYDVEFGIGSHIFDLEYVHQFQHALRLCGIEKEIVL